MQSLGQKILKYVSKRLIICTVILLAAVCAFFSSMKTSNVYFLLNDALKARLDVILLNKDIDDNSKFFSYDYLSSGEYKALKQDYELYKITNYGYKYKYGFLFVWPWQTRKTITVKEAVFAINGQIDTAQVSKSDALAKNIYNVPDWKDSKYRVTLVYSKGSWYIDSINRKGDYKYVPVATPSLTKDEIQALRTPTPEPTPESTIITGENGEFVQREAVISTALSGQTVNLREGPATAYKILKVLKAGQKLTVVGESDGWYQVTCDGVEGYVSGYYISFS